MNFPHLNHPNPIKNVMKFDLDAHTKLKINANDQSLEFKIQDNYIFPLKVLLCIFKKHLAAHTQK